MALGAGHHEAGYTQWNGDTKKLFGSAPFDYSKSPELITHLMKMAHTKDDDIILDFFSGSSTTAHAVMFLNAEDSVTRKFIMVQLPEECPPQSEAAKAGYATICDIGRERIRRAGQNLSGDTGFRVLKLDTTNYRNVFFTADELTQDMLDDTIEDIKPDRTVRDLLFMCVSDFGLPLSLNYREEDIDGFTVYVYDDGGIVACFDEGITI